MSSRDARKCLNFLFPCLSSKRSKKKTFRDPLSVSSLFYFTTDSPKQPHQSLREKYCKLANKLLGEVPFW